MIVHFVDTENPAGRSIRAHARRGVRITELHR